MPRRIPALLSLLLAFASAQAVAEPLTLEKALSLARERNEAPAIGEARRDRARALTRQAWARLLPELVVTGQYTRRSREVEREVGGTQVTIQSANALAATGTVQTRLLDAPAIPLVMQAHANEEAAKQDARFLEQALAFDVASSFYAVLSAEELLAAAKRRVEVSDEAVQVAQRRLAAGVTGKQEVTRTRLELSNARLARSDAELLVRTTRLALGELLATQVDMPLVPPAEVAPPAEVPEGIMRPDLLALKARVRAAELQAVEPWLRLLPSIDIGAQARTTNEPGLSGTPTNWSLFAGATWVLYDGGLRYGQAAEARAEAEELRLTLSAQSRAVAREEAEAKARIAATTFALEEARTATRVARENAEEVERLFAAGLATALERADATASAYEAEAELARKVFALRVARLEERRARGLWPTETGP